MCQLCEQDKAAMQKMQKDGDLLTIVKNGAPVVRVEQSGRIRLLDESPATLKEAAAIVKESIIRLSAQVADMQRQLDLLGMLGGALVVTLDRVEPTPEATEDAAPAAGPVVNMTPPKGKAS